MIKNKKFVLFLFFKQASKFSDKKANNFADTYFLHYDILNYVYTYLHYHERFTRSQHFRF